MEENFDLKFMQLAFLEAKKAFALNEVPVGAIVVKDNIVISKGFNKRESNNDVTAHAEIIALKKAAKKLGSWRLPGCKIYVTLEPCPMCASAIMNSRIDEVIFGAKDPNGGALVSSIQLYKTKGFNFYPSFRVGPLEKECSELITKFFKIRRENNKK